MQQIFGVIKGVLGLNLILADDTLRGFPGKRGGTGMDDAMRKALKLKFEPKEMVQTLRKSSETIDERLENIRRAQQVTQEMLREEVSI